MLIDGYKVMLQQHVFAGDLCPDGKAALVSQTLSCELLIFFVPGEPLTWNFVSDLEKWKQVLYLHKCYHDFLNDK